MKHHNEAIGESEDQWVIFTTFAVMAAVFAIFMAVGISPWWLFGLIPLIISGVWMALGAFLYEGLESTEKLLLEAYNSLSKETKKSIPFDRKKVLALDADSKQQVLRKLQGLHTADLNSRAAYARLSPDKQLLLDAIDSQTAALNESSKTIREIENA